MKRILSLAVLLAASCLCLSCLKDTTFYVENAVDFLTVLNGKAYGDAGATYTITDNQSEITDWNRDNARFFAVFDILNANMDIRVKSLQECLFEEFTPRTDEDPEPGHDPITVVGHSVSGGYFNLQMSLQRLPGTTCEHKVYFQYKDSPTDGKFYLYVYHDGNDENSAFQAANSLETEERVYSVPVYELLKDQTRMFYLITHQLKQDENGHLVVVQDEPRQLYSSPVRY